MKFPVRLSRLLLALLVGVSAAVVPSRTTFPAVATTNVGDGPCAQSVTVTTGVTEAEDGDDCVVSFTAVGSTTWTVPAGVATAEVLIVGGGGAGGGVAWGGGGGGGGVLHATDVAISGTVGVTVGAGGQVGGGSGASGDYQPGGSGGPSSFGAATALGGGGGAGYGWANGNNAFGIDGGSGGGAGEDGSTGWEESTPIAGGSGTQTAPTGWSAYGNDGGNVYVLASQAGAGGGGAGAPGADVPSDSYSGLGDNTTTRKAGAGGDGAEFTITGSSVFYGGGGGGGTAAPADMAVCAAGGSGGGGDGGCGDAATPGEDGTGGGGGGAWATEEGAAADGGSGVVIVRYSLAPDAPTLDGLTSGDGEFTVDYTLPTHRGGSDLKIEYELDGSGTWIDLGETDGSTVVSSGITNSTLYSVKLRVVNTVGDTTYESAATAADVVIPSPQGEILRLDATTTASYGGSGDTWTDLSGEGNHADSATDTALEDLWDDRARAFTLDGTNDRIALPTLTYDLSNGFALHVTADLGDVVDEDEALVELATSSGDDHVVLRRSGTSDKLELSVRAAGGTAYECTSDGGEITRGSHAYSVVVAADGTCDFLVDGVDAGTPTDNGETYTVPVVAFDASWVGFSSGSGGKYTEGTVQTVIITNTPQTTPTCRPVESTFTGTSTVAEDGVPYKVLEFATVGTCTWAVPSGVDVASAVIVGGGGGGGAWTGAGGGAGGVLAHGDVFADDAITPTADLDLAASSYEITVGPGGAGARFVVDGSSTFVAGSNGGPSSLLDPAAPSGPSEDWVAYGGGVGGTWPGDDSTPSTQRANGGATEVGSGGGEVDSFDVAGGAGNGTSFTAKGGRGLAGGHGIDPVEQPHPSGGGGGAGAAGSDATDADGGTSGDGGDGIALTVTGSSATLAGGGGGGIHGTGPSGSDGDTGSGGAGGGGEGSGPSRDDWNESNADTGTSPIGQAGSSGTGGGGGGAGHSSTAGSSSTGGDGGSGVVLIRYSLAPAAPTPTTTSSGDQQVTVSWTADSHTGGSAVTDYVIEYREQGAASWTTATDDVSTETSATVTGLTNGTTYEFRVRAKNTSGTGAASTTITGIPVSSADSYLTFDGVDDHATRTGDLGLGKDDFTVEAWVYDEATTNGSRGFIRIGTSSRLFMQAVRSGESNQITIGLNGSGSHVSTGYQLPREEWVHLALTRSGSTWKLYANGQFYSTGSVSTAAFDDGVWVGRSDSGDGNHWKGRIDQVKVWDHALSDAQVVTSMHTWGDTGITGGASAPDLVAHYDFNATSPSTLVDEAGSNDLTLSGSIAADDYADVATITTTGGERTVVFPRSYLTSGGGWKVPSVASEVRYLVVAGGGGGGYDEGGGGGAGGLRQATGYAVTAGDFVEVTVGVGGLGSPGNDEVVLLDVPRSETSATVTRAANGQSSTFAAIDATGGGGGGDGVNQTNGTERRGESGGSGGGGAGETYGKIEGDNIAAGNAGGYSPSEGNAGGGTNSTRWRGGAGGGGAGGAGLNGKYNAGGAGGAGVAASWTGLSTVFAAGGGGGGGNTNYPGGAGGATGAGAGGNNSDEPGHADANTGSGGGGGGGRDVGDRYGGGDGGSGIVVVRYALLSVPTITSAPANQTVVAGNDATFSVTATDATSYQWQVSTDGGTTWTDVSGATSASLTLSAVAVASDAARYRVVVTNTSGVESASTTSAAAILTVEDGATIVGAVCDGSYTKNGLTISAGHGEVFYIDTGQGQEIDAGYIAYLVESEAARSDLWVEVVDFTGGVVSLANADASTQPLGSISAGGSDTAFFMIRATGATTTAQSHVVNVYDRKPTIGSPRPLYSCGYTFVEVAETIKAAANKVQSITSTSATSLGSTMTITVQGDTGTIGQGNDIDGRMIWVTPAARSDWPTEALRLESTAIDLYSDRNRRNLLSSHSDTLRVNASTTPALDGSNRQYYTATYTFRVIGAAAATAPIIPIAMISSGTQIKHTDVGSLPTGGSATVDLTEPDIDLTVTKGVSSTTSVNADGTTTLSYTVTLTNGGSADLVIDEVIDTPDTALTLVAGSATFAGTTIADPGATGTASLAFSGPVTVPAGDSRVYAYDMAFETCEVGSDYSFDNVATARTGTVVIGSGSATQSNVNIAGDCGETEAVVTVTDELVDPVPVTGGARDLTATGATLLGTVDPNGRSGLAVRFITSTSADLTGPSTVTLADTTFVDAPYGVTGGLTGLTGSTTYYYALQVEDPGGGWITGATRSFVTDPVPGTVTVETTAASAITTTGAVLNGRVDADGVASGAKVRFEWSTSVTACSTRGASTLTGFLQSEDGSGGTEDALLTGFTAVPVSTTLTGLTADTDYCYRVIAYDGAGYVSATTGEWVPFTSTAKTTQTLSWSTSVDPLPAGGTTTVEATSDEGLSVSYASADTSVCTVDPSTGEVTAVATSGTCSITASQPGDATRYPAKPITTSFAILPPVVTPAALANGEYQTEGYSQTLQATGGDGTYATWAVSSGTLADGLTLDGSTGVISGTPTAAGVFTFSVTVKSNGITSAPQPFTVTITKRTVTVTASSPTVVYGSAAPSVTPSYSGFVGSDVTTIASGSNTAPACTSTYVVGQQAGTTATTSCSGGIHGDYVYTYVTGTVTVLKFPVTITALDAAKQNVLEIDGSLTVYADPQLQWVATSPLPAGQDIDDVVPDGITIVRTPAAGATGNHPAGEFPSGERATDGDAGITYAISASGTAGANYDVTYVPGTFTIQNPLEVPSLTVADRSMTYGTDTDATTLIGGEATNRAGGTVAGSFSYSYVDAGGEEVTLTDLDGLGAGTYTVKVAFTATDGSAYYTAQPVIGTMVLTVERRTITVTADDAKKLVGALDPTLTWSGTGYLDGDDDTTLGPVTIARASGETAGSYAITTSGGDTPNYAVTHVGGTFYVAEPVLTVTQSRGVLTSRTVAADCRGAKVGATATLSLLTGDTSSDLGTATVAADGTCPITVTLDDDVPQGAHTLRIATKDPLDGTLATSRPIILLAARIVTPPSGGTGGGSSGGTPTESTVDPLAPPATPGTTPRGRRPALPLPATPGDPGLAAPSPEDGEDAADRRIVPGVDDSPPAGGALPALPGRGGATVDLGDGVRDAAGDDVDGDAAASAGRGMRTLDELADERLGGFLPGTATRVEVLGARTGARFVATEEMRLDTLIAIEAIERSIPTQAADFFALVDVRPIDRAPDPEQPWSEEQRAAVADFFAASGLDAPVALGDLDVATFSSWVQVTGSVAGYLPGSVAYLTLTSEPLVLASAVIDRDGRAVLTGALPLEWLEAGEHRIRLVGIRALDGVSVDEDGTLQLSDELMAEIERFDLGTQSTVAVIGPNPDGAEHVALRVVPLEPVAPWWALWCIALALVLAGVGRRRGLLNTRTRRIVGLGLVGLSAVPGVVLGWLSTVTIVTWVALGLGLVAGVVFWSLPAVVGRGGDEERGEVAEAPVPEPPSV